VVESGNHEELIRKGTLNDEGAIYYEMWQKQLHDESETLNEEELAESDDEFSEDQNIKKLTESHPKLDLSNVDTKKKDDAIFVSSPIEEEPEAQQTNDVKITQDDETSNTDEGLTSGSSKDAKNSSASSSNSSNKKSKKKKKSKSKSKTTF
jgi:ATP-binding cassette subfamily B (MDR/TAP) protein 6